MFVVRTLAVLCPSVGLVSSVLAGCTRFVTVLLDWVSVESNLCLSVSFFNSIFPQLHGCCDYVYDTVFHVLFIVLENGAQLFVMVLVFSVGLDKRDLCLTPVTMSI